MSVPSREIGVELPAKLGFLLNPHRYKVVYGGRGGAKSWSFADALLTLGASKRLRILCTREIQRSIKDSVHKLLSDRIEALGFGRFYTALETEIRAANGTEVIFSGLAGHTVESIKSYEGCDICWVEEAQTVVKRSWDILTPTIRAPNSEIWVSFNPDMDTDETWRRFVENPPTGAHVVRMNYSDNPWFPDVLEQERKDCLRLNPSDYDNIWEGKPKSVVTGAIYAREVTDAIEAGRIRPMPYDPRLPVHTVWDLGWNDAMAIILVQKPVPTVVSIVGYFEDSFRTYADWVAELSQLPYVWGQHWLPHDGAHKNPQTGVSAQQTLMRLFNVPRERVPIIDRVGVEEGIRAARMLFPVCYIDNTARHRPSGYAGGGRLVECLKRYRRNVPNSTGEPATPMHDEYSHGADAFRGLAVIAGRIKNELHAQHAPRTRAYSNPQQGMGLLS